MLNFLLDLSHFVYRLAQAGYPAMGIFLVDDSLASGLVQNGIGPL
jgi:hypothetical protein